MRRPEIYVTAGALASGLYLLLIWAGAGTATAALAGALAGFLLRGAAIRWSLALPSYRGGQGGSRCGTARRSFGSRLSGAGRFNARGPRTDRRSALADRTGVGEGTGGYDRVYQG